MQQPTIIDKQKIILPNDATLKILELSDATQMFQLVDSARPYLRKWLPWVDGTKTVTDSEQFIRATIFQVENNDGFQAGIWQGDVLAGVIGFHSIQWSNRSTSIGYWLGESYQGNGLMTQACRAMVDLAFSHYQLHRVEIQAAVENHKSRRIPDRLGFQQEGCRRQVEWLYDHFVDHVVYGLLAHEWISTNRV